MSCEGMFCLIDCEKHEGEKKAGELGLLCLDEFANIL